MGWDRGKSSNLHIDVTLGWAGTVLMGMKEDCVGDASYENRLFSLYVR